MSQVNNPPATAAIVFFDQFQTLDAFGPIEVFGRLNDSWTLRYWSERGGHVRSVHGLEVRTEPIPEAIDALDFFLVPGGQGTRVEVDNSQFLSRIADLSSNAHYVLSVCTGSALLAAAGVLDGHRATSNKRALDWVRTLGTDVRWISRARWVVDRQFYTSSGVSAGIDMSLAFVRDRLGSDRASDTATQMEYVWNDDNERDHFAL